MSAVRVFVPRDATACALGADRVAAAIAEGAAGRGIEIELLRNGSRGAFWLEPLVEVETPPGAWRSARSLLTRCPACSRQASPGTQIIRWRWGRSRTSTGWPASNG